MNNNRSILPNIFHMQVKSIYLLSTSDSQATISSYSSHLFFSYFALHTIINPLRSWYLQEIFRWDKRLQTYLEFPFVGLHTEGQTVSCTNILAVIKTTTRSIGAKSSLSDSVPAEWWVRKRQTRSHWFQATNCSGLKGTIWNSPRKWDPWPCNERHHLLSECKYAVVKSNATWGKQLPFSV